MKIVRAVVEVVVVLAVMTTPWGQAPWAIHRSWAAEEPSASKLEPLFPADGLPAGWTVRGWGDVSKPGPPNAVWKSEGGVLRGSKPRGTWLVSEAEYGDFVLEFEFKLGERGNGGVGLRFPLLGDPTAEGLELEMVDPRFFGTNYIAQPRDLTGSLCKTVAPLQQVFHPQEWNHYSITCRGSRVTALLNDTPILEINLEEQAQASDRGKPLAQRPRRGHVGFRELSRGAGQVEIRNARIQTLPE